MKYRFMGKEKRLALGVYDEVSIKEADNKCTEARKLLDQNIDPSVAKKESKRIAQQNAENSLEIIARQWHENFKHKWSDRHAKTMLGRLERDIFPEIGAMPINEIKPAHLIAALKKVQNRGAYEPAHRLRQYCSQIFRYAIIHEMTQINPASEIGMVLKPLVRKHYACLEIKEIPELLSALERNDARLHTDTRQAIRLLMLTFVRTKELIEAKREEFDLENAEWIVPAERMKMRKEHIVPLSKQAIEILQDLKERNGKWEWIFPGHHSPRKHIRDFEIYIDFAGFEKFNEHIADKYIQGMFTADLSLSYITDNIRALKEFLQWLERQRGYRSKINFNHIDYRTPHEVFYNHLHKTEDQIPCLP